MPTWPNHSADWYIGALSHADLRVRRQAAAALEALQERRAVAPLIHTLAGDGDVSVRARAAYALGKLKVGAAVEPLIAALRGDASEQVRGSAAQALDQLGDPRAIEALVDALGDTDPLVRYHTTRTLGRLRAAQAIAPLLQALVADPVGQGPTIGAALGQIGVAAVEPLIELLGHPNAMARAQSAIALGMTGDPRATAPLNQALREDPDDYVRHWARNGLQMLRHRQATRRAQQ